MTVFILLVLLREESPRSDLADPKSSGETGGSMNQTVGTGVVKGCHRGPRDRNLSDSDESGRTNRAVAT